MISTSLTECLYGFPVTVFSTIVFRGSTYRWVMASKWGDVLDTIDSNIEWVDLEKQIIYLGIHQDCLNCLILSWMCRPHSTGRLDTLGLPGHTLVMVALRSLAWAQWSYHLGRPAPLVSNNCLLQKFDEGSFGRCNARTIHIVGGSWGNSMWYHRGCCRWAGSWWIRVEIWVHVQQSNRCIPQNNTP